MEWEPASDKLIDVIEDDIDQTVIDAKYAKLPFYHDGYLVAVETVRERLNMVLTSSGRGVTTIPLDGDGGQIRMANRMAGLCLSRDNMADYVRFFCNNLRGESGQWFRIEESADGKMLQNGHKLRDMTIKVRCQESCGSFRVAAYQLFFDTLFRVSLRVSPNGDVRMLNDIEFGPFIETRH